MRALVPCPGCHRHVASREATCPFCEGVLESAGSIRLVPPRLGRAATFAFGATLAGVAGCSEAHVAPDAGTGTDAPAGPDAPGGTDVGEATDAGVPTDSGSAIDAGLDAGGVAPPYGIPPDDAGEPMPLYGGPPEP